MPRQNLPYLQALCKEYGKVAPTEWPEGLIGVGPDMRAWVKAQDDASAFAAKRKPRSKQAKKEAEMSKDEIVKVVVDEVESDSGEGSA